MTRSFTVCETGTSPASTPTRAPMLTVIPPTFSSIVAHSPVPVWNQMVPSGVPPAEKFRRQIEAG